MVWRETPARVPTRVSVSSPSPRSAASSDAMSSNRSRVFWSTYPLRSDIARTRLWIGRRRYRSLASFEAVQTQAVGDNRDAGEGHGGPGDDGVEDAEGGQGDGGDVVAERPTQVLQDGAEGTPGQADGGDHAVEVT